MTDIAEPLTLSVDDRSAEARGFFDLESPAQPSFLPPPPPAFPTIMTPPAVATAMPAVQPAQSVPVGIPHLPREIPAKPSYTPNDALGHTAFSFSPAGAYQPTPAKPPKKKKGSGRRFVSWMLVLGVVGGAVYAGITYGPDLMARAQGETTTSEPEAPLAFPAVVALATPARTASFVIEHPSDDGSTVRYEVTNDFETGVSRMLVDHTTTSDIEVLAVFDVANLRQVDQPTWYSMPRGDFPFVGGAERQRWIRTVDDYFPPSIRPHVTIVQATESILGTETMRHLFVTVDATGIANASAVVVNDPVTGLPVPATPPGPGQFALPATYNVNTNAIVPITVEMWVDSAGIIRKLVEPIELGGATTTIISTSPDAFAPAFPAPETTTPFTAGLLAEFAL